MWNERLVVLLRVSDEFQVNQYGAHGAATQWWSRYHHVPLQRACAVLHRNGVEEGGI